MSASGSSRKVERNRACKSSGEQRDKKMRLCCAKSSGLMGRRRSVRPASATVSSSSVGYGWIAKRSLPCEEARSMRIRASSAITPSRSASSGFTSSSMISGRSDASCERLTSARSSEAMSMPKIDGPNGSRESSLQEVPHYGSPDRMRTVGGANQGHRTGIEEMLEVAAAHTGSCWQDDTARATCRLRGA